MNSLGQSTTYPGAGGIASAIDRSPDVGQRLVLDYYTEFLGADPLAWKRIIGYNLFAQPGTTQEQVIAGFLGMLNLHALTTRFASS